MEWHCFYYSNVVYGWSMLVFWYITGKVLAYDLIYLTWKFVKDVTGKNKREMLAQRNANALFLEKKLKIGSVFALAVLEEREGMVNLDEVIEVLQELEDTKNV